MSLVENWIDPKSPFETGQISYDWECECGNIEPWQDPKLDEDIY